MAKLNADDLRSLPRRDLQSLAKVYSIKANGSSNKIIEALCDRFPDGVPPPKRSSSPTTTSTHGGSARPNRQLSRRAEIASQFASRGPSSSSANVSRSADKSDKERLASAQPKSPTRPDRQASRHEGPVVVDDGNQQLRRMLEKVRQAEAASARLASENAALRAQLALPAVDNALQFGEEEAAVPSSSQVTGSAVAAQPHASASAQPITPTSLQRPQASLSNTDAQDEPERDPSTPSGTSSGYDSVPPSPQNSASPARPPSPVGLSRVSKIKADLDNWSKCQQTTQIGLNHLQALVACDKAELWGEKPSKKLQDRLAQATAEREFENERDRNKPRMRRLAKSAEEEEEAEKAEKREDEKQSFGELIWEVGGRALETYPHQPLSDVEERKNYIRVRDRAVHKDELMLPLYYRDPEITPEQELQEDNVDETYSPPYEDPDYDATSDATPSELGDVEMRDVDMSVDDDILLGVEGEGLDALLTDVGVILRGAPPKRTLRPTRAIIPDVQGLVHLPQGRETRTCWIPVKAKERVWVRCDQEVCTHGEVADATSQSEEGEVEGQEGCYFFDDLPEIAGRRKPKGRWVEQDVDLLEGGKYDQLCIKNLDQQAEEGFYGDPWGAMPGWKQRLERVPIWVHD